MKPIVMMKIKEISSTEDLSPNIHYLVQDKWDGYFVQVLISDTIQILSRRHQHYEDKLPDIVVELKSVPPDTLLLGELVYIEDGEQSVGELTSIVGSNVDKALQRQAELSGDVQIVFFDILFYNGNELASSPYRERLNTLEQMISLSDHVKIVHTYNVDADTAYQQALAKDMEGVVLKDPDSDYPLHYSGEEQSSENRQYKLKKMTTIDAVAYHYELGTGKNANTLGALFLGLYDDSGTLVDIGKVGTGFTEEERDKYLKKIKRGNFVVEVRFKNLTKDDKLRHPSFIRERTDKSPRQCHTEDLSQVGKVERSCSQLVPNPLRRNFDYGEAKDYNRRHNPKV